MCCAVLSRSVVSDSVTPSASVHGDSLGKNTGVACHVFPQGIFPTQRSNPGLLHCGQILCRLSHQRSARILKWVAYLFSSLELEGHGSREGSLGLPPWRDGGKEEGMNLGFILAPEPGLYLNDPRVQGSESVKWQQSIVLLVTLCFAVTGPLG